MQAQSQTPQPAAANTHTNLVGGAQQVLHGRNVVAEQHGRKLRVLQRQTGSKASKPADTVTCLRPRGAALDLFQLCHLVSVLPESLLEGAWILCCSIRCQCPGTLHCALYFWVAVRWCVCGHFLKRLDAFRFVSPGLSTDPRRPSRGGNKVGSEAEKPCTHLLA